MSIYVHRLKDSMADTLVGNSKQFTIFVGWDAFLGYGLWGGDDQPE